MTAKQLSPRAQVAVGLFVIAVGLAFTALAASHLGRPPDKLVLDAIAGVVAGLTFVFGGAIFVVPEAGVADALPHLLRVELIRRRWDSYR